MRSRVVTSQNWIQIKVWSVGDPEPVSWGVVFNDFLPFFWGTPKWVTVGGTGAAGIVRVDDVTIANDHPETIAGYGYDLDGRLTVETLPGGVTRAWNYTQGRLSGYTQTGGGLGRSTSLAYDSSGRIASETTGGAATVYTYDPAGQLTGVDAPGTTNDTVYVYDSAGRRVSQTVAGTTTGYVYNTAGQLVSATPTVGTPTTYTYDHAGRRTSETTGVNVRGFGYVNRPGRS